VLILSKSGLKRELGLLEATAYGVGIILGAGIYALIGKAAGLAGPALWMSFFIGAIIASLTGLSYAELGTLFPKEAAEYTYAVKAFDSKRIAFLVGWLIIITATIGSAVVSLGFGGYFEAVTGVPQLWAAGILIVGMSIMNYWGIKESAKMNIIFTLIELVGLILIILLAIPYMGSVDLMEMPNGVGGVMAASLLVFFAYIGFEDIVNVSEEMKNPVRTIPKALILSVAITTIIYILVSISAVSVLDWQILGESTAPIADVADAALPGSSFLFSLIALFATGNTVLIFLIVESRMVCGMARDGSMPRWLGKIDKVRGTPINAIVMIGGLTMLAIFWPIEVIAQATDLFAFTTFLFVNLALIFLRFKLPDFAREFKVPVNIGNFPVLAGIAVLANLYMITQFTYDLLAFGAFAIILGWVVYEIMLWKKWIVR
jgi:basic amino acid/polyamine antiporter, APA family